MTRVTVLTGGASAERAVAFAGAAQIVEALRGRGHSVTAVDTVTGLLGPADERRLLTTAVGREPPAVAELDERERAMLSNGLASLPAVRDAEVLFLCLHAGRGEGGTLQAVLDVIGVPYTGSGALGSALAMDKDLAKRLFRAAGVPVPAWFMVPPPVAPEDVTTALGWPVIVKPSKMGSSVGMSLVPNGEGLDAAVRLARAYDAEVMAEQFVPGRELTVGVLGDVPLPVGEIIPKHALFDYECKYTPGMSEEIFPAKLDTTLARQLQELALTAHRALKLGGYSRVDFRLSPEGDIFCLEANTLPGMTRTSLLPQAARAAGIEFPELCERICRLASGREGNSGSARGG
ncbi:MAG TPA: D-alanine--D-alanine ligase [Gemmatimonadales bacterium]